MTTPSHDQVPPAFRLPDDAGALNAWLEWLDANRLAPAAARIIEASAPDDARTAPVAGGRRACLPLSFERLIVYD